MTCTLTRVFSRLHLRQVENVCREGDAFQSVEIFQRRQIQILKRHILEFPATREILERRKNNNKNNKNADSRGTTTRQYSAEYCQPVVEKWRVH